MRKQKIIGLLFLLSLGSPKSAVFKEEETGIEEFGGALVNKTLQGGEVVQARKKRSLEVLTIISVAVAASNALCDIGTVVHNVGLMSKKNIFKLNQFLEIKI